MISTLLQSYSQPIPWLEYLIMVVISWAIFYYTVKATVKNGIIAAREEQQINNGASTPAKFYTPDQIKPQARYEKGEMSFEDYQKEWAKL